MQSQDQAMSPQRRMVLFAIVHDPEGNNIEASLSSSSGWRGGAVGCAAAHASAGRNRVCTGCGIVGKP